MIVLEYHAAVMREAILVEAVVPVERCIAVVLVEGHTVPVEGDITVVPVQSCMAVVLVWGCIAAVLVERVAGGTC